MTNELYLWDVRISVLPLARTCERTFQSWRLAAGSIPVVGSSRRMNGGSPINAMAVLSFLLFPPLTQSKYKSLIILTVSVATNDLFNHRYTI